MFGLKSTLLAVTSCAILISAAPMHLAKKTCTLMTDTEFGSCRMYPPSRLTSTDDKFIAVSTQAHNAIDAAALLDHGDHSHNLVVNDPDFPGSPANVCDNVATGTVWVEYNDSFKFAYSMDAILTPDERAVA
ncbi:hypothetical protein C8R43DRAFT_940599 [Mycena crocata]|nr:hypothetical protein C8R43DRAFT_940599 [Mycena crocata]